MPVILAHFSYSSTSFSKMNVFNQVLFYKIYCSVSLKEEKKNQKTKQNPPKQKNSHHTI